MIMAVTKPSKNWKITTPKVYTKVFLRMSGVFSLRKNETKLSNPTIWKFFVLNEKLVKLITKLYSTGSMIKTTITARAGKPISI